MKLLSTAELRLKLRKYAKKNDLKVWLVARCQIPNPFVFEGFYEPLIGGRNLYDVYLGQPISQNIHASLELFLTKAETKLEQIESENHD